MVAGDRMRVWSLPNGQKFSQFDTVEYNSIQHFLLYRAGHKFTYGLTSDKRLITGQNNTYMSKTGELKLFDYSWATLSYDE